MAERRATRDDLQVHLDPVFDRLRAYKLAQAYEVLVPGCVRRLGVRLKWPFADYVARHGDDIGQRIRDLLSKAGDMTPAVYAGLLQSRRRMLEQCQQLLTKMRADGFITLASSGPAPLGLQHTGSRSFLTFGSWVGLPGFSLPLMQVSGLPVGLQVLGMPHQDGKLCAHAHWFMRELGGA